MRSPLNFFRRNFKPFLVEGEKQNQTIIYLTASSLLILIFFGLRPTIFEVFHLNNELRRNKEVEKSLNQKIDNLNKAIANINRIRTDLSLIDKSLPNNKDLPYLLERLSFIFGSNNMSLEEIQIGGPKPSSNPKVLILPFSLRASGSYENIIDAIESLEKNPRQLDIILISMEVPQKGDKRFLKASLDLETYFLKEANFE